MNEDAKAVICGIAVNRAIEGLSAQAAIDFVCLALANSSTERMRKALRAKLEQLEHEMETWAKLNTSKQ